MKLNNEKMDKINSLLTKSNRLSLNIGAHGTAVLYDHFSIACDLDDISEMIEDLQELKCVVQEQTGLIL